ncbi:hypothetical protein [Nonomuraea sp. NPDC050310]
MPWVKGLVVPQLSVELVREGPGMTWDTGQLLQVDVRVRNDGPLPVELTAVGNSLTEFRLLNADFPARIGPGEVVDVGLRYAGPHCRKSRRVPFRLAATVGTWWGSTTIEAKPGEDGSALSASSENCDVSKR